MKGCFWDSIKRQTEEKAGIIDSQASFHNASYRRAGKPSFFSFPSWAASLEYQGQGSFYAGSVVHCPYLIQIFLVIRVGLFKFNFCRAMLIAC